MVSRAQENCKVFISTDELPFRASAEFLGSKRERVSRVVRRASLRKFRSFKK